MPSTIHLPTAIILYLLINFGMLLSGCTSSEERSPTTLPTTARPIAIINGQATASPTIDAALREAAGRRVLQDIILDRALTQRCEAQGIEITNTMLADERVRIGEALGIDSTPSLPTDVLDDLRAQRGLGPIRFEQLLRRNAMLRALVGDPSPSDEQIEQTIEEQFGMRYRIRLFVSESIAQAASVREAIRLINGVEAKWHFAEYCSKHSIHPSSSRGGLIESMSPASRIYPQAVRSAVRTTREGSCSYLLNTEAGYAVVFVEDQIPSSIPSAQERADVAQQLSLNLQRQAMQELAQEILESQDVIVMDKSLNWSWTNAP